MARGFPETGRMLREGNSTLLTRPRGAISHFSFPHETKFKVFSHQMLWKRPFSTETSQTGEETKQPVETTTTETTPASSENSESPSQILTLLISALESFERMARIRSLSLTQELQSMQIKHKAGLSTPEELRTNLTFLLSNSFSRGASSTSTGSGSGGGKDDSGDSKRGTQSSPLHVLATTQMTTGAKIFAGLQLLFWIALLVIILTGENSILGGMNDEPYLATTPDVTLDDVMGNEEAKEELQDIVSYLANPEKYTRLGAKLPKGILLSGPPGCGKTLLSRALAGEAGVPCLVASGSEFEEMFVGVGARRMRKLFKKAKQLAPCVVFIDEIDVIGADRDNTEYKSRYTLQQLLVELDGFKQNSGIMIIAATNKPELLDSALTRSGRFDRRVDVTLPDMRARKGIIDLYLAGKADIDLDNVEVSEEEVEHLAKRTTGFSGADLFNLVNTAKIEAAKDGAERVTIDALYKAREIIALGRERRSMIMTEEEKKIVAFHESGHTLVGMFTNGAYPIEQVTMIPRGQALGLTESRPKEDEKLRSKEEYLADIAMAMGGRAAEELTFGKLKITQGAGNDLEKATQVARMMVERFGMSEKVGLVAYDHRYAAMRPSPGKQAEIDEEVKTILQTSYEQAHRLLRARQTELTRLANALIEYETLSADEISRVIVGESLSRSPLSKPIFGSSST